MGKVIKITIVGEIEQDGEPTRSAKVFIERDFISATGDLVLHNSLVVSESRHCAEAMAKSLIRTCGKIE